VVQYNFTSVAYAAIMGFYYLRARYMDPSVGRFTQQDAADRQTRVTNALNPTMTTEYGADGRRTKITDTAGRTTNYYQLIELLSHCLKNGLAEFFFDQSTGRKSCFLGAVILGFDTEEEGSIVIHYGEREYLWMRETSGWELITAALSQISSSSSVEELYFYNKKSTEKLIDHLIYLTSAERNLEPNK
jgi:RHS repeat-associated protein